MFLEEYKIEGSVNLDTHECFGDLNTYPNFQKELKDFKYILKLLVNAKKSKTFYKFGDGDYYFLKKESFGSASPGKRALSKNYDSINHELFVEGSKLNDYYTCEIYPRNRKLLNEVIPNTKIDYPAEFGYGLIANKWLFEIFNGRIGVIGADKKIELIETLMGYKEYQDYLGLSSFNDYIKIPQKFACDNLLETEKIIAHQLENSTSDIFLLGIGHVKSGLLHRLKKYKKAVYLDVGSGIDALAGIIEMGRPYFGDWTNFQTKKYNYNSLDFLNYQGHGKHKILN